MAFGTTGVWVIGALGDIATTLFVGSAAVRRGLVSRAGLVAEMAPFSELGLVSLDELRFGGHDIAEGSVRDSAERVYQSSRTFSREVLDAVWPDLADADRNVVLDSALGWNVLHPSKDLPPLAELTERLRALLRDFAARTGAEHVVVVNLASSGPNPEPGAAHRSLVEFEAALNADRKDLISPSLAWVHAAFLEGCSYVNFTPNLGAEIPALHELAEREGLPFCGNDGKTGETLLKTALAPMFLWRNLRIMSWEGHNLLGNNDGRALNDPDNRKAKIGNKAAVLESILGYPVHAGVNIDYVPSLGDWKTAWDLIHFQGFLDVPMQMQFTWQGCDSILAAPLVLDLARLTRFAAAAGEGGPLRHLAGFFKHPIGVSEHAFPAQIQMLLDYVERHRAAPEGPRRTL
jgi:myo-inositol-1-phosphate synthase